MRLDSLGKPPILQVVSEPKKIQKPGGENLNAEVKRLSEASANTPEESFSFQGQKLGQIIEILSRAKKDNSKKKKSKDESILVIQKYKRVERNYQEVWNLAKKQRGDKIDIRG